jgi:hypothetical protein
MTSKMWKKILRYFIPSPILENDREIKQRLINLETLLQFVLENPTYSPDDHVGFNGQRVRKAIFKELLTHFAFEAIIETGSWVGNTTGYMAEVSGLPVWSSEIDPRFAALARTRLVKFDRIVIENCDSREFLKKLSRTNLRNVFPFFYLDAHWNNDLPLRDEIALIAGSWEQFVMLVDDFAVPGDSGYGFDDYGKGKSLSLDYIKDLLDLLSLVAYYPTSSSHHETGERRGCVILAPQGRITETLDRISLVRSDG